MRTTEQFGKSRTINVNVLYEFNVRYVRRVFTNVTQSRQSTVSNTQPHILLSHLRPAYC